MTTKTSLINDVTLYFHRAYLFVIQRNNMDNKVIYVSCMILISIRRLEQSAAFREVFCAAIVWKFLVFVQLVRRRFRSIALHPSVSSFLSARVRSRSHRRPRPDLLITLHSLCARARVQTKSELSGVQMDLFWCQNKRLLSKRIALVKHSRPSKHLQGADGQTRDTFYPLRNPAKSYRQTGNVQIYCCLTMKHAARHKGKCAMHQR